MKTILLLSLSALGLGWTAGSGDSGVTSEKIRAEAELRGAVVAWLDELGPELGKQALFPMEDPERRAWSNLPMTMFQRRGVSFGEMNEAQRVSAHRLLRSLLSNEGYLRVTGIMRIDDVLRDLYAPTDANAALRYGHDFYWLGVFGDPRGKGAWGLQLDGHHLALNVTADQGQVRVTPTFLGGNPCEVPAGPYAGYRVLGRIDSLAVELAASLTQDQHELAMIAARSPGDVLAGPGKADQIGKIRGLPLKQMTASQRAKVLELASEYFHTYRNEWATEAIKDLQQDLEEGLAFAWLGGVAQAGTGEPTQPYAYRIHGPRTWVEFSNTRGVGSDKLGMNHIHAVWRRLGDDYGETLLALPKSPSEVR